MSLLLTVLATTLLAGLAMPLGALIARFENVSSEWLEQEFRHSVMAFGGGALLSAVALVLVPEGIAHLNAFLLAGLIALQNVPEGFSAYRELNGSSAFRPHKIILMFCFMALLGPIAAMSGYLWLSESPKVIAAVMLFASGGILYSIFQDLAPQVKLEQRWAPPMGAVLGFCLGMLGLMLTA